MGCHIRTLNRPWISPLKALANAIAPEIHKNLGITPLIGSLSRRSSVNLYEAVTVLSQRLGGECYYLPSGTVHALGAGVLVAEVQTPSDITYRTYDWGRASQRPDEERGLWQWIDARRTRPR